MKLVAVGILTVLVGCASYQPEQSTVENTYNPCGNDNQPQIPLTQECFNSLGQYAWVIKRKSDLTMTMWEACVMDERPLPVPEPCNVIVETPVCKNALYEKPDGNYTLSDQCQSALDANYSCHALRQVQHPNSPQLEQLLTENASLDRVTNEVTLECNQATALYNDFMSKVQDAMIQNTFASHTSWY